MRTATRVFLASGGFILAVAAVYWFITYEWAGTILLGGTGAATLVMAGYAWTRASGAGAVMPGDRADADPREGEGEAIVSFTVDSPWPIVFGAGVAVLGGGLVFGFPLLVVGAVLIVIATIGMMRESVA